MLLISTLFFKTGHTALEQQSVDTLAATIETLITARNNIVTRHEHSRAQTDTDRHDLLVFISYMDGRIYYYCDQLSELGGKEALADTDCPTRQDGALEVSQYAEIPTIDSPTNQEGLSDLDAELDASIGSFDEMLLEEQQHVAGHIPRQRETYDNRQDGLSGSATPGHENQAGQEKSTQGSPGTSGPGDPQDNPTGHTPPGIPGVGSTQQSRTPPTAGNRDLSDEDDDIIARQLREAAEQESDPEVKAKLWEEYRRYKEGTNQ